MMRYNMFAQRTFIIALIFLYMGCLPPGIDIDFNQSNNDKPAVEQIAKRPDNLYYKEVRTFLINSVQYTKTKNNLLNNTHQKPISRLIKQADKIVNDPTQHTIVYKQEIPLNGDIHDFFTVPRYWHPDPNNKSKPWILKDGEINPLSESSKDDGVQLRTMCNKVYILARTYFYTQNQIYAKKATELIHDFFIDSKTFMRPALNYGGYVQGVYDQRIIGTIETANLIFVVESIGLLASYDGWKSEYQEAMLNWFDNYLKWLVTSDMGKSIKKIKNNIANWYDLQIVCYALFTGRLDFSKEILSEVGWKRLDEQINRDGFFSEEIKRTKSFSYSVYSLDALTHLANVSNNIGGYDLWNHSRAGTKVLEKAIQNLGQYVDKPNDWKFKEKGGIKTAKLYPILRRASIAYSDENYEVLIESIDKDFSSDIINLQYPKTEQTRIE